MPNKLQQYFPIIQAREKILFKIGKNYHLKSIYDNWNPQQKELFLDQCTGVIGFKLLYDSFFKEIMNPEYTPERLSDFLSQILNQEITVLYVIPNEGARLGDERSLILMDIVVRLDNDSIANLEIQKIGYRFPGQRCACYSSDLLLRQYKKVRSIKGKNFVYQDVKPVYTIVLFEKSPRRFKEYQNTYIHYFNQKSNTGLEIELLQQYVFIPLDIFKKILHNKGINNRLEAWLAFLCEDEPEWIIQICSQYPDFKAMYEQVYEMCLNVERMMEMWSKELYQLDLNTEQFMMDEMQETINQQIEQIQQQTEQIHQQNEQLNQQNEQLNQQNEQLNQQNEQLNQQNEQLNQQNEQLNQQNEQLNQQNEQLHLQKEQLQWHQTQKHLTNLLTRKLIEDNRTDDLLQASEDEQYRETLLKEYGLIS